MHLPDVLRLTEYWSRNPPLRDLVAMFMGVAPIARAGAQTAEAQLEQLPEFED